MVGDWPGAHPLDRVHAVAVEPRQPEARPARLVGEALGRLDLVLGRDLGRDFLRRRSRHPVDDGVVHDRRLVGPELEALDPVAVAVGVGHLVHLAAVVVSLDRPAVGARVAGVKPVAGADLLVLVHREDGLDAGHQRGAGPHVEAAAGVGPSLDGGLLVVAERPVVHVGGAQVRRQPRRHEVDAGDEGDVVGDGGRVAGGVECEGAPGRAARGVAAHAARFEDRLHSGRELAHHDAVSRDLAAQVTGRLRAEFDKTSD